MKTLKKRVLSIAFVTTGIVFCRHTNIAAMQQQNNAANQVNDQANQLNTLFQSGINNYNEEGDIHDYQQAILDFNAVVTTPNAQTISPQAWFISNLILGNMHYLGQGTEGNYHTAQPYYQAIVNTPNAQTIAPGVWIYANLKLGIINLMEQNPQQALTHFNAIVTTPAADEFDEEILAIAQSHVNTLSQVVPVQQGVNQT